MFDEEQETESASVQELLKDFERKLENLMQQMLAHLGRGYLSLKSASFYCDLSQKTLRRFISEGSLKEYRPARGKVLIKREELDALIEKSTKKIRRGRGIRR